MEKITESTPDLQEKKDSIEEKGKTDSRAIKRTRRDFQKQVKETLPSGIAADVFRDKVKKEDS